MIKELHQKIQKGKLKVENLTKDYLNRIKKENPKLNVYLEVFEEKALKQAEKIDKEIARGKEIGILSGLGGAVKDNILIKNTRTTAGSKILENYIAPYDAFVIEKLKEEEVIFLGKTNLDEFAMGSSTENSAFGLTKNPFSLRRVAGGSSGGSAAAVAADLAVFALGSDTGGSIRQPASFCGVIGLKPTYGRVSRNGLIAMASSFDQIGVFTKTVEDAIIVLNKISQRDFKDNTCLGGDELEEKMNAEIKGKRIGLVKEFFEEGVEEDVKDLILEKIKKAAQKGAEIIEIKIPHLKYSLAVYYLMQTAEVSSNLARFDGIRYGFSCNSDKSNLTESFWEVYQNSRSKGFGKEVKRRIILGTYCLSAGYYDAYYKKAQLVREIIKKEIKEAFEKVDILVSPVSPTPAFEIGEKTKNPLEMYLADVYTVLANVAMIPAISIPVGKVVRKKEFLPVGLQLMGKWWDEENLFKTALFFEKYFS